LAKFFFRFVKIKKWSKQLFKNGTILGKCLTNIHRGYRVAFKYPYILGDMIRGQCFLLGERSRSPVRLREVNKAGVPNLMVITYH